MRVLIQLTGKLLLSCLTHPFKVFSLTPLPNPQLLELILIYLSPAELLLNQRVCKDFNTVINDSATIQRMLWMRPTDSIPDPAFGEYNPFLVPRCFLTSLRCSVRGHSYLSVTCANWQKSEGGGFLSFRLPDNPHTNESWRKMYLTQPPIAGIKIFSCGCVAAALDSSKPLRLGDIVTSPGFDMCLHAVGNGVECRRGLLSFAPLDVTT